MSQENRFRIIGGEWRGRRVQFPRVPGIRPTPDRVRETLFNWLEPHLAGARCLDLFAGSGALGLEALSRGAASVVFVDQESRVVEHLQGQLQMLVDDRGRVVHSDAKRFLGGPAESFDIVFLDPPFGSGLLPGLCKLLEDRGWLAKGARVYIESLASEGRPEIPPRWEIVRSKRAGQVGYHLAVRSGGNNNNTEPEEQTS